MKKPTPIFTEQATREAEDTTPRRSNHDALSPRQARLLSALLVRPVMRIDADNVSGAINSPDEVMKMRRMGLEIDTERVAVPNRDGNTSYVGKYHLLESSRPLAMELLGVTHGR